MIYLVTVADCVLRHCLMCQVTRPVYVAVTEDAVIVACTHCNYILQRVALMSEAT
jgi:hypothetical protein